MNIREQMDSIYKTLSPEKIPWNLNEPPQLIIEAWKNKRIRPCRVVDLGCGAGNYSVWLARHGFQVTGLDISREAIRLAETRAEEAGVSCRFMTRDLLGDVEEFAGAFDLAIDWELLHHIFPDDRESYIQNVRKMLDREGIFLSVGFNENDPAFGGKGKYRTTRLGTILYFSSADELRALFAPYFTIIELKTLQIPGKYGPHLANVAWLRRDNRRFPERPDQP